MENIKKVIIWGHKLHTHTHSYIHYGFCKGFKHLQYDTYWFDNSDNTEDFDFSGSLFITEGQVDKNIPLRDDCYYILHNIDQEKYKNSVLDKKKILVIQVYTNDCVKRNELMVEPYTYFTKAENDDSLSILYFPWATDLLPYEIEKNIEKLDNVKTINNVCFIGSQTEETEEIKKFCLYNKFGYVNAGGFSKNNVNADTHQKMISESILSPAIQTKWQVENGYIPCRIFKNISYGKMGITNSETVFNLFEKKIIYNKDIVTALILGFQFEKNETNKKEKIVELMNFVKEKHTYINRINLLLKYLFE
jgi:hypothetical protein